MQQRHFLVKEDDNGSYILRELDSAIADSVSLFGIMKGQCFHSVDSNRWTFYFMNGHISEKRADQIAEELTSEFLAGTR